MYLSWEFFEKYRWVCGILAFACLYSRSNGHHLNIATSIIRFKLLFTVQLCELVSALLARKRSIWRGPIKDALTNALIKSRIASLVQFFTGIKRVGRFSTKSISAAFCSCHQPSWRRPQLVIPVWVKVWQICQKGRYSNNKCRQCKIMYRACFFGFGIG